MAIIGVIINFEFAAGAQGSVGPPTIASVSIAAAGATAVKSEL